MAQRMNIAVSDDMREWLEGESKRLGMAMSAVILMALNTYINQQKTIEMADLAKRSRYELESSKNQMKSVLVSEFAKIGYDLSWNGDEPIIK